MHRLLVRMKPRAQRRVHLALAASMWSLVGTGLLIAGGWWLASSDAPRGWLLGAAAVATGALKARFVLRRTAQRLVRRIASRDDARCLGGFLSWRTWLVVITMSVSGRLLRASGIPTPILGFVYIAVGTALLVASWWPWKALGAMNAPMR